MRKSLNEWTQQMVSEEPLVYPEQIQQLLTEGMLTPALISAWGFKATMAAVQTANHDAVKPFVDACTLVLAQIKCWGNATIAVAQAANHDAVKPFVDAGILTLGQIMSLGPEMTITVVQTMNQEAINPFVETDTMTFENIKLKAPTYH